MLAPNYRRKPEGDTPSQRHFTFAHNIETIKACVIDLLENHQVLPENIALWSECTGFFIASQVTVEFATERNIHLHNISINPPTEAKAVLQNQFFSPLLNMSLYIKNKANSGNTRASMRLITALLQLLSPVELSLRLLFLLPRLTGALCLGKFSLAQNYAKNILESLWIECALTVLGICSLLTFPFTRIFHHQICALNNRLVTDITMRLPHMLAHSYVMQFLATGLVRASSMKDWPNNLENLRNFQEKTTLFYTENIRDNITTRDIAALGPLVEESPSLKHMVSIQKKRCFFSRSFEPESHCDLDYIQQRL